MYLFLMYKTNEKTCKKIGSQTWIWKIKDAKDP